MKTVALVGGAGRMGQTLAEGLAAYDELTVVALVDRREPTELFGAVYASSLDALDASSVDVVVDFSSAQGVDDSIAFCRRHHKGLVVGATGLTDGQRAALLDASSEIGVAVSSNFAVGAVLADRFAAEAARFFERVEIIELHHEGKLDAPSGTSITTARRIADSRRRAKKPPLLDSTQRHSVDGARGADAADGVRVHSVRLPGLVAHQEILFGSPGEGLTIRHDSYDRRSYVYGVAIAACAITAEPRYLDGIGELLD